MSPKHDEFLIRVKSNDCSLQQVTQLQSAFQNSFKDGYSCLNDINADRKADADSLKKLFSEKEVHISCNDNSISGYLAVSKSKPSPDFLHLALSKEIIRKLAEDDVDTSATFFHEFIHWLGYEHFNGIDIPYLAEACCFQHAGIAQSHSRPIACALLKFKNDEWVTPQYNSQFMNVLSSSGRGFIGIRTTWNAAIKARQQGFPKDEVLNLIYVSITEMNRGYYEPGSNRSYDSEWSKTEGPAFGMIFGAMASETSNTKLKMEVNYYLREIKRRFYGSENSEDKIKLQLWRALGKLIYAILDENPQKLIYNWNQFSKFKLRGCPFLKENERQALEYTLTMTHLSLFKLKKLPPNIYTTWNKSCP